MKQRESARMYVHKKAPPECIGSSVEQQIKRKHDCGNRRSSHRKNGTEVAQLHRDRNLSNSPTAHTFFYRASFLPLAMKVCNFFSPIPKLQLLLSFLLSAPIDVIRFRYISMGSRDINAAARLLT